ncbi:MAG: 3-isopropylmalate dehydrogenase [Gammaproteobacteria bacterium]|nr:3-isopropylmalate dehydrogenase [Gammaproteobacteria bacterium]
MKKQILILPGDGIGPEVVREACKILTWFNAQGKHHFELIEGLIGGAAIDATGVPLPETTIASAKAADSVLLGAVGGPKWESLPTAIRPEKGLLHIRKALGLYANLRPAVCFSALADASPLKKEWVADLDLMIVRELTGGIYFGEPRGIEIQNGERKAFNTMVYSESEIERVAKVAFDLARVRSQKVCSIDKANVLEVSQLWREIVQKVHDQDYPDVALSHMYVDNAAMQLVYRPSQFDVMLTSNLFGDILSDEASMLTGSLGMLPSASFGDEYSLYEPIHGSAPDIAGKNIANPLGAILSVAMMFKYTFKLDLEAAQIMQAVEAVLEQGIRTRDLTDSSAVWVSTSDMGDAVKNCLSRV